MIVPEPRPDRFFPPDKVWRLSELMTLWRAARDAGTTLSPHDQAQLQTLVDEELQATVLRAEERKKV